MPLARISIFGSSRHDVEEFIHRRTPEVGELVIVEYSNGEVACEVKGDYLEILFHALVEEARRSWENPAEPDLFNFASASMPYSASQWYPVRRLRGSVEARLARKKERLPAAQSLPSLVFSASEENGPAV